MGLTYRFNARASRGNNNVCYGMFMAGKTLLGFKTLVERVEREEPGFIARFSVKRTSA